MVGHGGSSAGSYLADPTSPIPSHCASIVATSTVRVNVTYMCRHTAVDNGYYILKHYIHIPVTASRAKRKHNAHNILANRHTMTGVASYFFGLLHFFCLGLDLVHLYYLQQLRNT